MIDYFKKFSKQILIYGLGDTISKLAIVIILPIFTNYLSPQDYGVVAILTVTNTLMVGIFDLGLINGLFRFYHEGESRERQELVGTAQLSSFGLSLVIVMLLLPFSFKISHLFLGQGSYSYLVFLNFLAVPFTLFQAAPIQLLRLEEKAKIYTFITVARVLIGIGLSALLIIGFHRGLNGYFEAPLINAVLFSFIMGVYTYKKVGWSFTVKSFKKMFFFGSPFLLGMISIWIMNWADRFILGKMVNLTEVGLYNLGYSIALAVLLPIYAFVNAWTPFYMSISNRSNLKQIHSLVLTYYSLIMGFIVLILITVCPDYFRIFTGEEFHSAYIVVPLVSFAYTFEGVFNIIAIGSFLKKKPVLQIYAEVIAVVLNLIFMFILIPYLGRMGAAWATLVAYASLPVSIYFLSKKTYSISYDFKRLFKILIIGLVIYFINKVIYQPTNVNLILRLGILLFYPILLLLLGFFQESEIGHILSFKKKIFKQNINTMAE